MAGLNPWTERELEELRLHYPTRGPRWEVWQALLNGRSRAAIVQKARMLGVRYEGPRPDPEDAWTEAEDAAIDEALQGLVERLGRKEADVGWRTFCISAGVAE